jgi:hypothetical protein
MELSWRERFDQDGQDEKPEFTGRIDSDVRGTVHEKKSNRLTCFQICNHLSGIAVIRLKFTRAKNDC